MLLNRAMHRTIPIRIPVATQIPTAATTGSRTPRPERSIRPLDLRPIPRQRTRNKLPPRSLNLIVPLQIPDRTVATLIRQVVKRSVVTDRSLLRRVSLRTPSSDKTHAIRLRTRLLRTSLWPRPLIR